jgi:hypothetical protein
MSWPRTRTGGQWTPMHLASERGQVEARQDTYRLGAWRGYHSPNRRRLNSITFGIRSTDSTDWQPNTSTQILPQRYAEIACILLERGADVTVQDQYRLTPFDLALSSRGVVTVLHVIHPFSNTVTGSISKKSTSMKPTSVKPIRLAPARGTSARSETFSENFGASIALRLADDKKTSEKSQKKKGYVVKVLFNSTVVDMTAVHKRLARQKDQRREYIPYGHDAQLKRQRQH